MIELIIAILIALFLIGLIGNLGGNLIYILLVAAVILYLIRVKD